jgi:hypothetical protein
VLTAGVTVLATPLDTEPTPLFTLAVPFAKTAVNALDPPCFTELGEATKLVIVGAATTVTPTVRMTEVPAAFVTVKVYVVVTIGETEVGAPLDTAMFPGVITPEPPANTPVRVVDVPAVIGDAAAVKLVIVGAATTVTAAVCVVAVPAAFVTVSVYVVVLKGDTLIEAPLVTGWLPGVITPVPPLNVGTSTDVPPTVIVPGVAVKPEIAASGTTVSVAVPCTASDAAVIVAEPAATAEANPPASIVAMPAEELDQVTEDVTSPVLPSV